MANSKEPDPERHTDPTYGLLSKVFIVYPHNPEVYQWIPPTSLEVLQRRYPEHSPDELRKCQVAELKKREVEEKERIERHDQLVHNFAQFLNSHKIAVAYEGLLHDCPTDNYMRWFQKQMKDSDYVMLIITPSFCQFLSNEPPQDKERIFVGQFLHNFVHRPSKPILPVFLNSPKCSTLLPDALKASATYHVVASRESPYFNVQQPELDRLYAVLTKQNRMLPPSPNGGVVLIDSGIRRRIAPRPPVHHSHVYDERHKQMDQHLKCIRRCLTGPEMASLSQCPGFATQWRFLAEKLDFTAAEIERVRNAGQDDAERCYQLLRKWDQMKHQEATVTVLAEVICRAQNNILLEIMYSVFAAAS